VLPDGDPGLLTDAEMQAVWPRIQGLTMVPQPAVRFALEETLGLIRAQVPGVLVECGVWRGGCSLGMLLVQRLKLGRVERPVYLLDSFQGLPPVTSRDGPLALRWQQGGDPSNYLDNCRCSKEEVQRTLEAMQFGTEEYRIVEGWFEDTLPGLRETLQGRSIALLRLDGDWYDSTRSCLDQLMPLVSEGGVVIVDDYYAWDGCARALHDYLSRHDLSYRIRSLANWYGAYFVKQDHRDRFDVL
jgi:O-methyltransferase